MLVIGNGRMITQDASNPFLENGAVAMDGNTIVMVGVTEEVKKVYPDAEFVDAKGGVIMPAFINAHEHIYSSFAASSIALREPVIWPKLAWWSNTVVTPFLIESMYVAYAESFVCSSVR